MAEENQNDFLNRRQAFLNLHIAEQPFVEITYFVADAKKSGGSYEVKQGNLKRIDESSKTYKFTDGTIIPFSDVIKIESEIFPAEI